MSVKYGRILENTQLLFVKGLLRWNKNNTRIMPWKGEKDPYKIWISEIILQQTRVEQGMKYYENFISSFPNVHSLAKAPAEKVFKLWEGLGYYSRCKNLIQTSQHIVKELNGVFPTDYSSILKLKGVGPYTAAAIGSFAYNLPYAVLDGNVFRVLSRILNIHTSIDSVAGKKEFAELAQTILPKSKAGEYNQAIMDFGAVICKPVPECKICFFNKRCKAFQHNTQQDLPIKQKKIPLKKRWLNYVVAIFKKEVLIHKRTEQDIWQHLFEFLLIETTAQSSTKQVVTQLKKQYGLHSYASLKTFEVTSQKLSHQLLSFNFILLVVDKKEKIEDFEWVPITRLHEFAFPKTLKQFIAKNLQ